MEPKTKPRTRAAYRGFESIVVPIVVRVGRVTLSFERLSDLGEGAVLRLDLAVGAPFDLLAAGELVGRVEPIASDGEEGIALKLVAQATEEDVDGPAS